MSRHVERTGSATIDFFISYSHKDEDFARTIDNILREANRTTIVDWQFPVGANIINEMERAGISASRTIALFSENYLKSEFCEREFYWTKGKDPDGGNRMLVPVMIIECDAKSWLGPIRYLDLTNCDEAVFKSRLLKETRPDFFISYSPKDEAWARAIAEMLRLVGRTTIADWRFPVGVESITDEMARHGISARQTVALGSPDYLESPKCESELTWTINQDPAARKGMLVPLMVRPCDLDKRVRPIKCIDMVRCHQDVAKRRFLEAIGASTTSVPVRLPVPWLDRLRYGVPSHPILSAAIVLLLLACAFASPKLIQILWPPPPIQQGPPPKDYFASMSQWSDTFRAADKFAVNWHRNGAERQIRASGGDNRATEALMEIARGGYALAAGDLGKASFYDFDADFMVTVSPKAEWAFRVWPQDQAADIRTSRGYMFTLEVLSSPTNDGSHFVRLSAVKCKQLGKGSSCAPLTPSFHDMYPNRCTENSRFQISARVQKATFTFKTFADRDKIGPANSPGPCDSQELVGLVEFHDEDPPSAPSYPFGALAFWDAQIIHDVHVFRLNTLGDRFVQDPR